jgi:hypothetical protein
MAKMAPKLCECHRNVTGIPNMYDFKKRSITGAHYAPPVKQQLVEIPPAFVPFALAAGLVSTLNVTAEPVVAEPVVAEPVVAEPVVAESVVAESVVAEPDVEAARTSSGSAPSKTLVTRSLKQAFQTKKSPVP